MATTKMTAETRADGRKVLTQLATATAAVVACLFVIDITFRLVVPSTSLLRQPIDIQTPEALYAKLEDLRHFKGTKIVMFGDSLVFGRTMREYGDADWQSQTLASQLERELAAVAPGRPVMVANFGMNGTLPADLEHLVRIVTPLRPDLIIFDLSLRSFSRDFESDDDNQTRPWLAHLSITPAGHFGTTSREAGFGRRIHDLAVNTWYLYRLKDTLQALAFDGQPVVFFTQLRNRIDAWLKGIQAVGRDPSAHVEDELILMLKARARYARIDLAPDNPQRQALDRLLARLHTSGQPALAFYATENAERLDELIDRPHYDALHQQLRAAMAAGGSAVQYVGPLRIFSPANYLDHVHLDREGYRRLADHMAPLIERMVAQRRPPK